MPLVEIITVAALLQFMGFAWAVGRARVAHGVPAPATSGNEIFERYFRVQMNTAEQLIAFLPALWLFAWRVDANWAAALGAMTYRFAELWLVQGYREYDFDHAAEQLTRLWANALGLDPDRGARDRG